MKEFNNVEELKEYLNQFKFTKRHNFLSILFMNKYNLEIVKYLVENTNVDVNFLYKNRDHILFHYYDSLEIVKYLVENTNINVNKLDINGRNALFENRNLILSNINDTDTKLIKYLVENTDINVNHIDDYGNSILDFIKNIDALNILLPYFSDEIIELYLHKKDKKYKNKEEIIHSEYRVYISFYRSNSEFNIYTNVKNFYEKKKLEKELLSLNNDKFNNKNEFKNIKKI